MTLSLVLGGVDSGGIEVSGLLQLGVECDVESAIVLLSQSVACVLTSASLSKLVVFPFVTPLVRFAVMIFRLGLSFIGEDLGVKGFRLVTMKLDVISISPSPLA